MRSREVACDYAATWLRGSHTKVNVGATVSVDGASVEGSLRSGPARNEAWLPALTAMRTAPLAEAVQGLAAVRDNWLDSPDQLMRAARHYEAAAAQLIAR